MRRWCARLIAPMAEAAAESRLGRISDKSRHLIRAHGRRVPTMSGAFFGEDIFIAVGSILLIKGFLQQSGFDIEPLHLSLWAIPTAILAFVIHGTRLASVRPQIETPARRRTARTTRHDHP